MPHDAVGRQSEWGDLEAFVSSETRRPTLALVWGRRQVGKSFLLAELCRERGFYYEALRGSATEALADLGRKMGEQVGAPGPLGFNNWEEAIAALLRLGAEGVPVVLDEYPYLLEHSPELDSVIQRALGGRRDAESPGQCRLILCGSALSVMGKLLSGTAPLRGRAGLDLRVAPFGYRDARRLFGTEDLALAVRLYSVIGGVAAYSRDMVDNDLPGSIEDFDAWVARRVLSASAPLSREVEVLLSEDPATGQARRINLYHAALAGIALGRRTPGRLADYVGISGPRLDPILRNLVDAGFVRREIDPIRESRPTYHPGDPLIRFHYVIARPHQTRLARHGADLESVWHDLDATYRSQVLGPAFEDLSRDWVTHHASVDTIGGDGSAHVGSSSVRAGGQQHELDVVVARDDEVPAERSIVAIGEAKSGERIGFEHLTRLESMRAAYGARAAGAKLLLIGSRFEPGLNQRTLRRSDVEVVGLDRLFDGS